MNDVDFLYRILDDCGINDLKHPQLFAKADLLAQVAHTLRVDNPTQTELVGRLIDVKAEAVKAPLKKYILAKQVDTPKDDTLPCKCQALAWQKVPKAWTQALWRYKEFLSAFFIIFFNFEFYGI